jgi:hypothetical protein
MESSPGMSQKEVNSSGFRIVDKEFPIYYEKEKGKGKEKNIAKDSKVIPDPIDDRKFQE